MLGYTLHHLSSRFTAGVTTRGPKRTKTEGKTLKNGLLKDGGKTEPRQEGEKKEKPPQKRNLYYAELRASCFCPHFLVFLIRQAADK